MSPEVLSKTNPKVKRLRRLLSSRKARSSEGVFVVEGPVQVAEALFGPTAEQVRGRGHNHGLVEAVFVDEFFVDEYLLDGWARVAPGLVHRVASEGLAQVLTTKNPQPVAAIVRRPVTHPRAIIEQRAGPILVLVDLADPGNVGTLIRTAEGAGMVAVLVTANTADWTNPKALRAAAGAALRLPVATITDLGAGITQLTASGREVAATTVDPEAPPYDRVDLRFGAIILGNEAHGLNPQVLAQATTPITIPLAGPTESLNVAAAGAVLCFESLRQRRQSP